MINKAKRDAVALGAIFECAAYGESPCPLLPSRLGRSLPPLLASNVCLLNLINRNVKVTPLGLMKEYGNWVAAFSETETSLINEIEPHLLQSLQRFLKTGTTIGLAPIDELKIDSSSLVRLGPLAFYLARYRDSFSQNPPFMYHLIASLSSLTVGHRRAAVACGLYLNVAASLVSRRIDTKHPLAFRTTKIVMRRAIQQSLIYYNSTLEYRGETGYYAVLQMNKDQELHLETMPFEELHQSSYAVDILLNSLWFMFNVSSVNTALVKMAAQHQPDLAQVTGFLYGLAYGHQTLNDANKKRFEIWLKSS